MLRLIKTECWKYKRDPVLWAGLVPVLCSILLAAFQLTGTKDSTISYGGLSEGVIWNHFSLFLPFTFTLLTGRAIDRESTDGTLKNLLAVPVHPRALVLSKLAAGYGFVLLQWLFSFLVTLALAAGLGCGDISPAACKVSLWQLWVVSSCCYLAVLPVVLVSTRKPERFLSGAAFAFFYGFCGIFLAPRRLVNLYPVTCALVLAGYAHEESVVYVPAVSLGVMAGVALVSLLLVVLCHGRERA